MNAARAIPHQFLHPGLEFFFIELFLHLFKLWRGGHYLLLLIDRY